MPVCMQNANTRVSLLKSHEGDCLLYIAHVVGFYSLTVSRGPPHIRTQACLILLLHFVEFCFIP